MLILMRKFWTMDEKAWFYWA